MNSNVFKGPVLYTAPRMDSDDLIGGFIAHESLFSRLLSDIDLEGPGYFPQHYLLLGGSGIGKTTFLTHLAFKVARDAQLSVQWWPLLLAEPQYNVSNMADFWRNCLYRLADSFTHLSDVNGAAELSSKILGLASADSKSLQDLLMYEVKGRNKRLLLMIDDMDLLLSRGEEIVIKLVSTLQNEADVLVIGTGSNRIQNLYGNGPDFSEIFQVIEFKDLREDDIREAMLCFANGSHSQRAESFLNNHPDRFVMLHRLSGGNLRTMTLIYNFIAAGVDGDIRSNLALMLDVITPAYLARMASLSVLRQKIVDIVAIGQDPIGQTQITTKTGLTQKEIAFELAYLEQHGFVSRVNDPQVSNYTAFEISERLFNVWYLMYSGRPARRRLIWLVLFLREFFSAEELEIRARDHIQMPSLSRREMDYTLALIQAVDNKLLRATLEYSVLQALTDEGVQATEIYRLFYWKEKSPKLWVKIERLERLKALEHRVLAALSDTSIVAQPFCEALMGSPTLSENEKVDIVAELADYSSDQWAALDKFLMDECRRWRRMLGHHAAALYKSIASGEMSALNDTEGAESVAEHWQDPVLAAISWAVWIDTVEQPSTQKIDTIEQVFRRSIEADPNVAVVWNSMGNLLQFFLQRYTEAETAYWTAIELDPQYIAPWNQKAYLLKNHFKQFDEAEKAYKKTIELDPRNPAMYNNFAWFLYQHGGRIDDAVALSERACELDLNDLYSIHTRATLLVKRGDWEEAVPFIRRVVQQEYPVPERTLSRAGLILFREIVEAERAPDAVALLDDLNAADPWSTIRRALEVIVSEGSNDLVGVDSDLKFLDVPEVDGQVETDRDGTGNESEVSIRSAEQEIDAFGCRITNPWDNRRGGIKVFELRHGIDEDAQSAGGMGSGGALELQGGFSENPVVRALKHHKKSVYGLLILLVGALFGFLIAVTVSGTRSASTPSTSELSTRVSQEGAAIRVVSKPKLQTKSDD